MPNDPNEQEESHTGRNLAMAGAAISPFGGMIGQQSLKHDPHLNPNVRRMSLRDISRAAKPGDVLLTSKPSGSIWKHVIKPLSGSEFYHAQPIVGRRDGHGVTMTAGLDHGNEEYANASHKRMIRDADTVNLLPETNHYDDLVLMRPKKPLSPEQAKAFAAGSIERSRMPYDTAGGVRAWVKDLFQPKLKMFENGKNPELCVGSVCSTDPAMGYADVGGPRIKGKSPKDVMPADFLRSGDFEAVGTHLKNKYTMSTTARRALPLAARAGLGAGMAGAIYAGTEDPATLAVPVGMAAGSAASAAIAQKLLHLKNKPDDLFSTLNGIGDATRDSTRKRLAGRYLARRAPGVIGGGVLSYLAARKTLDALKQRFGQQPDAAAQP